ncbi:hypothetical protein ISS06_00665 [Patescibacteria group bacterium]|nr:hypothetical protein [Patescibacteria group bacterium]
MNKKINLIIGIIFLLIAIVLLFLDIHYLIIIGIALIGLILLFLSLKGEKNLPIVAKEPSLPTKTEEEKTPVQPSAPEFSENIPSSSENIPSDSEDFSDDSPEKLE